MNLFSCLKICNFRFCGTTKKQCENKVLGNIKQNYLQDGTDIKWENTEEFKFPITGGRVIKVYDGDTITIAAKLPYDNSRLFRFPVRLNGIDCPEIKGKTEEEKNAAKKARDVLADLILNKYVRLENVKNEKYGRMLADVYLKDLNLNNWMLQNRYAVKYEGGTKKTPLSWNKYMESYEN